MTGHPIVDNGIIAKFMGLVPDFMDSHLIVYKRGGFNNEIWRQNELKYHKSWDWLIPVVEKIESIQNSHHGYFAIYVSSNGCTIQGTNFRSDKIVDPPVYFNNVVLETKMESVYTAILSFIEWHNKLDADENKG